MAGCRLNPRNNDAISMPNIQRLLTDGNGSMGARGPKKGEGGRPRKRKGAHAANSEGYARITTGSKKNPKRIYEHQVGMPKGGSKGSAMVIDHKDGNKLNNKRSNLRMMKRGKNARRGK